MKKKSKKIFPKRRKKNRLEAELKKLELAPNFAKALSKPLKFSRLTLIILGIIFLIFILFLVLNFIFSIILNQQVKTEITVLGDKTDQKIAAVTGLINQPPATQTPTINSAEVAPAGTEIFNSFGDSFTALAFIDGGKSNMSWDANVTSFSFPPLYSFEKVSGDSGNSVSPNSESLTDFLNPNTAARLTVVNNRLYYRNKKINLPSELKSENILNINVALIGSRWLVGIVTGRTYDERGWVYFYDPAGQNFSPLITAATTEKIAPKFERLGGTIAFGGVANNFLIVYGGYDGHALYYHEGTLTDVSKFFGLRVSADGFNPEILSRDNSLGTIFYLCSQSEGKPKLIKFWPKNKEELMGAIDFSPLVFSAGLGAKSASCEIEKNNGHTAAVNILLNVEKTNGGPAETWRFIDKGFDNSRDRELISYDIGQGRGLRIKRAVIADLGLNSDGQAEIFLTNNSDLNSAQWQEAKLNEWLDFETLSGSLFWKATFKAEPGNPDYSPWFDQINQLNYTSV